MMPAAEGELASIYNQVLKTMLGIHNRTEQVENLKRIAEGERSSSLERKNSFRMMIWLVSYYEFFDKKVIWSLRNIDCNVSTLAHYIAF